MSSSAQEARPLVFLDLDGVCCDFLGGLCKKFGRDIDDLPTGIYDLPELFNTSFAVIDDIVRNDYQFWRDLKPYPHTAEMMRFLHSYGEVRILSTAWNKSYCCHLAKLEWCAEHLKISSNEVILTPHKHLLAAQGRLLIDDRIDTCVHWCELGGSAVIFPTHHNSDQIRCLGGSPFHHLLASLDLLERLKSSTKTHEQHHDRN